MATTITIGSHIYYPVPRTSVPTQLRWDDDPLSSPEARIYYAHGQPNRYQAGAGAMWRRCADVRWGDSYWQLHEERVPPAPVVRMDGPAGPRIEYGDEHNQSDLDAAMPAGYRLGTDGTAGGGRWSLDKGRWRRYLFRIADQRPCSIVERGNGFPDVGGIVVEPATGERWRVVSIDSGIQTGDRMRGEANYVHATVVRGTDDDAESICSVRFDR